MATKQKVKGHTRKGKKIKPYTRTKRKKGKGRKVDKKPLKLYKIRNSNGEVVGYTTKKPKAI